MIVVKIEEINFIIRRETRDEPFRLTRNQTIRDGVLDSKIVMEANKSDAIIVIQSKETNRIVGDEDIDSLAAIKVDVTIINRGRVTASRRLLGRNQDRSDFKINVQVKATGVKIIN